MMAAKLQHPFEFGGGENFAEENFVVSDANRRAYALLVQEAPWHSHALVVAGPAASGKSHLAHIWASRHKAARIAAAALSKPALDAASYVVEDIERLASEEALFHLFNHVVQARGRLLLTSTKLPEELPLILPDLRSRLKAAQVVQISLPDDALLKTLLIKQFADRQLKVGPEVVAYLLSRMPRSFAAAKEVVAALDEASLSERRNISISLAREVLERVFGSPNLL
jgi:chromosomal replication initiation ATPase DnaA